MTGMEHTSASITSGTRAGKGAVTGSDSGAGAGFSSAILAILKELKCACIKRLLVWY